MSIALKKDAADLIRELESLGPLPVETLEPRLARDLPTPADAVRSMIAGKGILGKMALPSVPLPVGRVEHRVVPGRGGDVLVRLYAPDTGGPHPVLVYFHGGGWVIGSLDAYDGSARALCREAGCIVASVAYRQAPEHRFPAAAEDAHAATQWAFQNAESFGGDPERVAIAGESAGGNLATVACLMAKEEGGAMPLHQLLVYPVTKYNADFLSYAENRDAKPLNAAMMAWFWSHYLPSEEAGSDWRASPLAAPDLAGLPPATVLTAEADPLRDEGEAYAERLKNSGVPTKLTRYEGMPHEFFGMGAVVADARRAVQEAATALKGAFERPALRRTVER